MKARNGRTLFIWVLLLPKSYRGTAFGTRCDTNHRMTRCFGNGRWSLSSIFKMFNVVSRFRLQIAVYIIIFHSADERMRC